MKVKHIILVILTLSSCARKFTANRPAEYYNKVDTISEPSTLNLIASFSVKELQKKANDNVPATIYEDNSFEGDNYIVKVTRKGDISIVPNGGIINITIPLEIYAKAKVDVGFFKAEPDARFELDVYYTTVISASPDWKIVTKTKSNGFKWITPPVVNVGPLEVNVGGFIENILVQQQDLIAQNMDKKVAERISLKDYVEKAWSLIQTPLPLSSKMDAWIKVTPSEVYFIPAFGDSAQLKTGIGIKGMSETFIGSKPVMSSAPLPELKTSNEQNNRFSINLAVKAPFDYAKHLIKEHLKGQTLALNENKQKVKVEDLDMYGSGEKLIVKALLSGDFNGIVYLSGIPYYDSSSAVISIKDLDFDFDSKNKLIKVADWLAHGSLVKKMEKEFRFPIKTQIEDAKSLVNKRLEMTKINNLLTLNGKLDSIEPKKIFVIKNNFLVFISAKGKLEMTVNGF